MDSIRPLISSSDAFNSSWDAIKDDNDEVSGKTVKQWGKAQALPHLGSNSGHARTEFAGCELFCLGQRLSSTSHHTAQMLVPKNRAVMGYVV